MPVESALEHIWQIAPAYCGPRPTERDYLKALHHPPGLCVWWNALNVELSRQKLPAVSVTSIWVDHTPQCWFGSRSGQWWKPSCELADLLIVAWDNARRSSGRALLVQAKKGKSHSRVTRSNASTKKELQLLGRAPRFLLSGQTATPVGASPAPINPAVSCEFKLAGYTGTRLDHCTFLQIKDTLAKRWPIEAAKWQTMWPPSNHRQSYSAAMLDMAAKSPGAMGKAFRTNNTKDEWDRLVNVLISETMAGIEGTAGGSRQNTIFHIGDGDLGLGGYGRYIESELVASNDPRGISTIFITPEHDG